MRVDEGPGGAEDHPRDDRSQDGRLRVDDPVSTAAFTTVYVSPRDRRLAARNAVIAASTGAAVLGAACVFAWVQLRRAADDVRGGTSTAIADLRLPEGDATLADHVHDVQNLVEAMSVVSVLTLIVSAYYVVRWQSDALRQQHALGVDEPRFSAARAGWAWFVPIWSLFGPKQAYNDLWRASEPGAPARAHDRSWLARRPSRLLTAWWAAWLVGSLVGVPAGNAIADGTIGDAMDDAVLTTIGCVGLVVAGVLYLRVMDAIIERSDRRAAELGLRGVRGLRASDVGLPD